MTPRNDYERGVLEGQLQIIEIIENDILELQRQYNEWGYVWLPDEIENRKKIMKVINKSIIDL